jgi:putative redox protein
MEAIIHYLEGVKFKVEARGHTVICDQPAGEVGSDAGMTPPEFLLASLGSCAAYYAAEYLRTRSLPMEGLTVRISAEKGSQPARIASFRIEIGVPGLTDERHKEGVIRSAKRCLIHNTLLNPPEIGIVVTASEPAATAVS